MSNQENPLKAGSKPAARTIFTEENARFENSRTDPAQKAGGSESRKVKFPQTIRYRRAEVKIYGKTEKYAFYRLGYYSAGKRHVRHFATYSEAKTEAERIVRELASGSQAAALSASQSRDALAALERLESYHRSTGNRISLLGAVSEYVEAARKLDGQTLGEAVERYLATVASVKRKDIQDAVEEFIRTDEPRTKAKTGLRAQICPKYAYNRSIHLRRFAATFSNSDVCDLAKEHLDIFIESLGELTPKTRNHFRTEIRQFLSWCMRKDYLPLTHRLKEADLLRPEHANTAEVQIYAPNEFQKLLESAEGSMQAMIAIGGLAGLRTSEMLRLDWEDVWRVPGHIEITSGKAKTRQRRLVEIAPALSAWLQPFRGCTQGKPWTHTERTFQEHFRDLCERVRVERIPNGLRHSFCSFHFALHSNEGLTSAQAGNSPSMIHAHYKGLATREEAERWFAVTPASEANVVPMPVSEAQ